MIDKLHSSAFYE